MYLPSLFKLFQHNNASTTKCTRCSGRHVWYSKTMSLRPHLRGHKKANDKICGPQSPWSCLPAQPETHFLPFKVTLKVILGPVAQSDKERQRGAWFWQIPNKTSCYIQNCALFGVLVLSPFTCLLRSRENMIAKCTFRDANYLGEFSPRFDLKRKFGDLNPRSMPKQNTDIII